MFSFLNNIPTVTRNLLILNILMFILTAFFESQHINLTNMLGAHYIGTPLFEPYQIVSHFFMHGDVLHIFFNMFGLVIFGGFLERIWGPKRFFIFYISSALGAFALYNGIGIYQLSELKHQLISYGINPDSYYDLIIGNTNKYTDHSDPTAHAAIIEYIGMNINPTLGASGAIFGIMAAFAILFPNTELMLLFFPVPIKAKYLIGFYVLYEIYQIFYPPIDDHINHLAHVGGAIVGAIFVLFWRRNRNHFY